MLINFIIQFRYCSFRALQRPYAAFRTYLHFYVQRCVLCIVCTPTPTVALRLYYLHFPIYCSVSFLLPALLRLPQYCFVRKLTFSNIFLATSLKSWLNNFLSVLGVSLHLHSSYLYCNCILCVFSTSIVYVYEKIL